MADYKNNRADRSSRRPAPVFKGPALQADPRTGRTGFPRPNVAATNASAGNQADRSSRKPAPVFRGPVPQVDPRTGRTGFPRPSTAPNPPMGGIPASVNPPGWNGVAYQDALQKAQQKSPGTPPPPAAPPQGAPTGGSTAPAPTVQPGFSQQRIDPGTGQPVNPATPAGFTSIQPGSFAPGAINIDKDALARAAWNGEGFTNKLNIQAEDNSKVFANGFNSNPNGFALAGNLLGGTAMPSQPGTAGFAAAAGMPPLVDTMGAGSVPMSTSSPTPGVMPAAFGTGPLLGETPSAEAAVAPEEAAQNLASGAVNKVMSLQNQIREHRGMPLLVE